MHEIRTEAAIIAKPERVWSILLDFPSYLEWNSFIRRNEGLPNRGERLTVLIQPPGASRMTFRPTVLKSIPNQELRWLGRFIMPGIFDGEHSSSSNRSRIPSCGSVMERSSRACWSPLLNRPWTLRLRLGLWHEQSIEEKGGE